MSRIRTSGLLFVLAVVLLAGCSSRHMLGFYHVSHRERYAITGEELRGMQFYVSKDVLVQPRSPAQAGADVIILREGTPGVVVDSGPDWIRVSFQEGGTGVRFVADGGKPEDLYWLATQTDSSPRLSKLNVLSDKVLLHDGERYSVVEGADAVLFIDRDDLEKLINSRPHLTGVTTSK